VDEGQAYEQLEKLAHDVLSNPVIEAYEIQLFAD
jgi:phosphoribosylformylglycinamidine (FGAM) synthase PurS component